MDKEPSDKHYVIVGLGNPGKQYELTRHNMGYLVVQAFAEGQGWKLKVEGQFNALVAKGKIGEATVHLLLPLTYMNASGQAVKRYLDFYKLPPKDLIVVTDDIGLAFGDLKIRIVGGPGGHNGLRSIQEFLQTIHYTRLRVGIGLDKPEQQSLADYVLEPFTSEEREKLLSILKQAGSILERLVVQGVTAVINSVNVKPKSLPAKEEKI